MAIQQDRFLSLLVEAERWKSLALRLLELLPEDERWAHEIPPDKAMLHERWHFDKSAKRNEKERLRQRNKRQTPKAELPPAKPLDLSQYSPKELKEMGLGKPTRRD